MLNVKQKLPSFTWEKGANGVTEGPVRRSQLIAPFGTGALIVARNGASLISGGLDHWFEREDGSGGVDIDEYKVREWRLERLLEVDHFRLPADFRRSYPGQHIPNARLTHPFLRFPQWHFCPSCSRLFQRPLTERGRIWCPDCASKRQEEQPVPSSICSNVRQGTYPRFPME